MQRAAVHDIPDYQNGPAISAPLLIDCPMPFCQAHPPATTQITPSAHHSLSTSTRSGALECVARFRAFVVL
jgi:hypothetical protein